jgi:hypothetical protein
MVDFGKLLIWFRVNRTIQGSQDIGRILPFYWYSKLTRAVKKLLDRVLRGSRYTLLNIVATFQPYRLTCVGSCHPGTLWATALGRRPKDQWDTKVLRQKNLTSYVPSLEGLSYVRIQYDVRFS